MVGYSWKTNQYGLTIDTVTAFELVLPDGSVKTVTEKDEDLWFALKVRLSSMRSMDSDLTEMSSTGRTEQLCELDHESLVLCLTTSHQGIVTKFTFEVHEQTNVWVCHLPSGCHVYVLTQDT